MYMCIFLPVILLAITKFVVSYVELYAYVETITPLGKKDVEQGLSAVERCTIFSVSSDQCTN